MRLELPPPAFYELTDPRVGEALQMLDDHYGMKSLDEINDLIVERWGDQMLVAVRKVVKASLRSFDEGHPDGGVAICKDCGKAFTMAASIDPAAHPCFREQALRVSLFHSLTLTRQPLEDEMVAESVIPQTPSNRSVLNMAKAWGCTLGKTKRDRVAVNLPDGTAVMLFRENFHKGNSAEDIVDLAQRLGLTLEEFWSGPKDIEPVREPDPDVKPGQHGYIINQVLETLIAQKIPMSAYTIAEMLGLEAKQAAGACNGLVASGAAVRVKRGMFQAAAQERSVVDHRGPVELTMTAQKPVQEAAATLQSPQSSLKQDRVASPTKEPAPLLRTLEDELDGVEVSLEEILELVLDTIAPHGFQYRHLAAIDDFRDATVRLMKELRN